MNLTEKVYSTHLVIMVANSARLAYLIILVTLGALSAVIALLTNLRAILPQSSIVTEILLPT